VVKVGTANGPNASEQSGGAFFPLIIKPFQLIL